MPISDALLSQLLQHASQAYQHTKISPYQFAETAAHLIVKETAAHIYLESADAAACIAAIHAATKMCSTAHYATQLALEKSREHQMAKRYEALLNINRHRLSAESSLFAQPHASSEHYIERNPMAHYLAQAMSHYHSLYPDPAAKESLSAACAQYPYAHACVYHAYIYATSIAARYAKDQQHRQFQRAIERELSHHLGPTLIDPSLWISFMCSHALLILILSCLLFAIIGLTLGSCGIALPAMGGALATVGISSIILTAVAATALLLDFGLYGCRYWTHQKWEKDNQTSQQAMLSLNRLSMN